MTIDVEEYVSSFRPEMMDFAADWCNGATFKDIQKRSDFFEVNKCLILLFTFVVDSVICGCGVLQHERRSCRARLSGQSAE